MALAPWPRGSRRRGSAVIAVIAFDTSALIRRYDRREPGAEAVRALCHHAAGHILLIAQITSAEVASAPARKSREGLLGVPELAQISRLLRQHRRGNRWVCIRAERLLFAHPLRVYDAVQLASALTAREQLRDLAPDFRFCTADQRQAVAADAEGLATMLIA